MPEGGVAMERRTVKKAAVKKSVVKKTSVNKAVVKKTSVNKAVVKKVAARATKASAKLENRAVPAGYVRPASVKRLLAERQTRQR
jgi:hypothetical protein